MVQITPGSNILAIKGVPVTMDVVAEVVVGRVMVPFRWVAQAFGVQSQAWYAARRPQIKPIMCRGQREVRWGTAEFFDIFSRLTAGRN